MCYVTNSAWILDTFWWFELFHRRLGNRWKNRHWSQPIAPSSPSIIDHCPKKEPDYWKLYIRHKDQFFFSNPTGQLSIDLHIIFCLDIWRDKKYLLGQWDCINFVARQKSLRFNEFKTFLFCLVNLLPFCEL